MAVQRTLLKYPGKEASQKPYGLSPAGIQATPHNGHSLATQTASTLFSLCYQDCLIVRVKIRRRGMHFMSPKLVASGDFRFMR